MAITALASLAGVTAVAFFVVFGVQLSRGTGTARGVLPIPSSFPLTIRPATSSPGSAMPQASHFPAKQRAAVPPVVNRSATPVANPAPGVMAAAPSVNVRYMTYAQGNGFFQAYVTIYNNGTSYVGGWRLALGLPGDSVLSIQYAAPDMDGDFLILRPNPSDPAIPPGRSLEIVFIAQGPTTSPLSCTFNGFAC
jgi:hypothetical protein